MKTKRFCFYSFEGPCYKVFCATGRVETVESYPDTCPVCGKDTYSLSNGYHHLEFNNVYVRDGKLGYVQETVAYGIRRDGSRECVYSRPVSTVFVVANLATGKVYHITRSSKKRARPRIVKCRWFTYIPDEESLRKLLDGFRQLTGYEVERVGFDPREAKLIASAVFGACRWPPVALVSRHSLGVFVDAGLRILKMAQAERSRLSATDPVGVLEQLYKVNLGRSVLRFIEEVEEQEIRRMSSLSVRGRYFPYFADTVRLVGLDLAKYFMSSYRVRQDSRTVEVLGLYLRYCEPAVAVRRLHRILTEPDWGMYVSAGMILDAFNMARQLDRDPREVARAKNVQELRRLHDFYVQLYDARQNELKEDAYRRRLPGLKKLEYRGDRFWIRAPESLAEIVEEGRAMSHCVGSYTDWVADGGTAIYFLRTLDDERVGTLEVRDGEVVQAFGPCNSILDREAQNFVLEWAKQHRLDTSFTYGLSSEVADELLA